MTRIPSRAVRLRLTEDWRAELLRARSSLSTLSISKASLASAARNSPITVVVTSVIFSTRAFVAARAASSCIMVLCRTTVEEDEDAEDSDPWIGAYCGWVIGRFAGDSVLARRRANELGGGGLKDAALA
jgi:hypothetical protein